MRIAIDAGHGLYTPGKRCLKSIDSDETREWSLNSRLAGYLGENLMKYNGIEIIRTDDTTGYGDIPLNTRTKIINLSNIDLSISVHHNAGVNGGSGGGIVVYSYITYSDLELKLQTEIYNQCIANGGLTGRSQPVNHANLHMVREPKCTAILVEYGFMDSTNDTPVILTDDYSRRMASATASAIAEIYNLSKKESEDNKPMTEAERKELEALKKKVNELESKQKVYHYYSELPNYAKEIIPKLHKAGIFAGNGANDMNLPEDMMRMLIILYNNGIIKV